MEKNGDCIGSLRYQYSLADHLGNTRAVYADLLQEEAYYPFGMRIPGLSYDFGAEEKYLYNGKELEGRLAGFHFSDYGARFYDAALGRWHSVNPLAEEYTSLSPYNYVGNNPMLFIDPNGMGIDYSGIYQKDDDGNYLNEQQIRAFEAFAMTDVGHQYITERAQEGFSLKGIFEKNLNISVDKAGSLDSKGVDVSFSVEKMDHEGADAEQGLDVINGRLQLSIQLADKKGDGTQSQVFNMAESIGHEVFYHADEDEKRFLNLPASERTVSNIWTQQNHNHTLPLTNTKYYKVGVGYLQQVQKLLGYSILLPIY